jgi:hypothetical protein
MNDFSSRGIARLTGASLLILIAACAHAPEPEPEPELVSETPVRVAPPVGAVAPGDCPEALRRAAEKNDLPVDRLASPKALVPPPIPTKAMPVAVRHAKYNEVRVSVLVDTLGKADMRTFTVVKTTHPWLASSVKAAVAKWSFSPAELAGCKVPRLWLGAYTSGKPPAA